MIFSLCVCTFSLVYRISLFSSRLDFGLKSLIPVCLFTLTIPDDDNAFRSLCLYVLGIYICLPVPPPSAYVYRSFLWRIELCEHLFFYDSLINFFLCT